MTASKRERRADKDRELVEKAKAGELRAFEELVNRYERKVYNIAYRITKNREEAEEVLQETFLSVYKSLKRFKGKSAFSTWLYRIAVNAALMRMRKKRVETVSLDEPLISDNGDHLRREIPDWSTPEDEIEKKRLMQVISEAIDSLPDGYKTVVLLRDGEGLSNSEVAHILKTSVPSVKAKLHRARMHLRSRLSDYFAPSRKRKERSVQM